MTRAEITKEAENLKIYQNALLNVYADGSVDSLERNKLIALKNELGLTDSDCQNLEGPYKLIAKNAKENKKTTFEDLCKCHHCHCFDHEGNLHFNAIDYSAIEYLNIGDTYIETTTAGYTGLKENFAVSIGQSFKDLINEYGEEYIYDAVKDGKLQTFDDSCNYDDMVGWIITKLNFLTQEEVSESYTNLLNKVLFPTKKLEINNAEQSLTELANVIKNKSFLTLQNPELNEVIFDYGSFGDLTTNKSSGGNGIIHIIQRRAEIDRLSDKDISSLLLKIKDISENEKITGYDKTGTRAFINKDGIRVLLQKNWNKNLDNWLVTGYGIMDSNGKLNFEATETIKTVNAQYGYKPEHSLLREQVGAVIASIDTIRQQQLKVKQLKEFIRIEKGTKRISSANPHNVYDKAVIKSSPKNCSDKELLNSLSAAIYAQNALKNANNSELYKHTKNKKILETAGNQKLIDGVTSELQSRGYVLNIESTLNETNIHFQHQIFVDIGKGKERKIDIEMESLNQQSWKQKYDSLSIDKNVGAREKEFNEYIHSEEFISKFGDWEKASRLVKLAAAPAIIKDGKVIIDGEDITEEVKNLRNEKDNKVLRIFAKDIGRLVKGTYHNDDLNVDIALSMGNIDEIKNHHMAMSGHLEAIQYIPDIIKQGIYIAEEPNEDKKKHPNIEKYKYFVSALNIGGVDYTCKSAVGVDKDGNHYYDQRLSQIEKGLLLTNLAQLMSRGNSEQSLINYDKRLLRICQCPQTIYLDENLIPTKETVEAVKNGQLLLEKDTNGFLLLHDNRNNRIIGKELSDMILNKELEERYMKTYEIIEEDIPGWEQIYNSITKNFPLTNEEKATFKNVIGVVCEAIETKGTVSVGGCIYDIDDDMGYIRDYLVENLYNCQWATNRPLLTEKSFNADFFINSVSEEIEDVYKISISNNSEHFYIVPNTNTSLTITNFPKWAAEAIAVGSDDYSSVSDDEEINQLNEWMKENRIQRLTDTSEPYFSNSPEFGLPGECVDASFALYPPENNLEKSKSDKEIIQDYISKIKETLPAFMKNSVETVLTSSAKALSSFSKEEKLVIGKYLTKNGVTNSDNLGSFLKKKVEPEKKHKIKRDIEIERGR